MTTQDDGKPYYIKTDLLKIEHDEDEEIAVVQYHGFTYNMDKEIWFIGLRNDIHKILLYTDWKRKILLPN